MGTSRFRTVSRHGANSGKKLQLQAESKSTHSRAYFGTSLLIILSSYLPSLRQDSGLLLILQLEGAVMLKTSHHAGMIDSSTTYRDIEIEITDWHSRSASNLPESANMVVGTCTQQVVISTRSPVRIRIHGLRYNHPVWS